MVKLKWAEHLSLKMNKKSFSEASRGLAISMNEKSNQYETRFTEPKKFQMHNESPIWSRRVRLQVKGDNT